MNKKNRYGQTTAINCFYCSSPATTKNKDGISVCRRCKDRSGEIKCPVCNMELEVRNGKYGDYLFCWACGKGINKYHVIRMNILKNV